MTIILHWSVHSDQPNPDKRLICEYRKDAAFLPIKEWRGMPVQPLVHGP